MVLELHEGLKEVGSGSKAAVVRLKAAGVGFRAFVGGLGGGLGKGMGGRILDFLAWGGR